MKILIINGPNLNRLGKRDPGLYGKQTLEEINTDLKKRSSIPLDFFQSNSEGAIIDAIQAAEDNYSGIIINPGAYSHYSFAIRDAIESCTLPVVEVHISNITARESFRQQSVVSPVCTGTIAGLGPLGYHLAVEALKDIISRKKSES